MTNFKMKKAFFTVIAALTTLVSACAGTAASGNTALDNLVNEFKDKGGIEVVAMGPTALSLVKSAAVIAGDLDKEDRQAVKLFKGIKRLVVVDFEDMNFGPKQEFTAKLDELLGTMSLILEAKDDGDTVRIYGKEDGDLINDCIIYADEALIYVSGGVNMNEVNALIDMEM